MAPVEPEIFTDYKEHHLWEQFKIGRKFLRAEVLSDTEYFEF